MKKSVFIVILTWNHLEDTKDCLASLENIDSRGVNIKVVVVDNNSTDGSLEFLRSYQSPRFEYYLIENSDNLGFAGGNNKGLKYSLEKVADFTILLNNDTKVNPHLISGLLKFFAKEEKIGIVSPKIYFEKNYEFHKKRYKKEDLGKVIWYAGGNFDWENISGTNKGVDEVDHGQHDNVLETEFATGACMCIRREVLEQIGLLDEKYFMYLEDVEFSQRAKSFGWKVFFNPEIFIWHKVSRSSAIGGSLNDYFIARNRLLFGMKYGKARTKVALVREGLRLLSNGREWQKRGVRDYFLRKFGRGSWQ